MDISVTTFYGVKWRQSECTWATLLPALQQDHEDHPCRCFLGVRGARVDLEDREDQQVQLDPDHPDVKNNKTERKKYDWKKYKFIHIICISNLICMWKRNKQKK